MILTTRLDLKKKNPQSYSVNFLTYSNFNPSEFRKKTVGLNLINLNLGKASTFSTSANTEMGLALHPAKGGVGKEVVSQLLLRFKFSANH